MMVPVSPPEPLPTRLGDFMVDSVLGEGGSGIVYAARWGHREVALKVLRSSWLSSEGERRRFLAEARLLAAVNHPSVVRILGFGELPGGSPYLAMERLEGEPLGARLSRGAVPLETALELFAQLCDAVATLHDHGLIHRDIKPENVFLVGQQRYAVLLDFGIAKPIGAPDSTVTREGGVRGTPAYMAPERFFGTAAGPASDIYELGVLLYSMLVGRLPWDDLDDPVGRLNPRRPGDLGVSLPGSLEETLLAALSSRPDGRPPTVRALAAAVAASPLSRPAPEGGRQTLDLKGVPRGAHTQILPGSPTRAAEAEGPPIASYWSDSSPSIVLDDLGKPDAAGSAPSKPAVATISASVADQAIDLRRVAEREGPFRAAALGAALPTPSGDTAQERSLPSGRRSWHVVGWTVPLAFVLALLGVFYWPQPRQRLALTPSSTESVPVTAARHPSAERIGKRTGNAASERPPRRNLAAGREHLIWTTHPEDTTVLVRLSNDQLTRSEVFATMTAKGRSALSFRGMELLEETCNISLLERVEWASVGLSGSSGKVGVDLMLQGSWTRDEVERCVASLGDKAGVSSTIQRRGAVTLVKLGASSFWMGWPAPRAFLLSNRDIADEAWIRARLAGEGSAARAEPLRALYDRVDPSATLWAVISSTALLDDAALEGFVRPQRAALNLKVASDIFLGATVFYSDPATGRAARRSIRGALDKLAENQFTNALLARAEVTGEGSVARLALYVDRSGALLFAAALSSLLESASISSVARKAASRGRSTKGSVSSEKR